MRSTTNYGLVALLAVCLSIFLIATNASAVVVLYEDDFSGGAGALNGVAPDVNNFDGTSTWTAGDAYTANGTVLGTLEEHEGSLTLSFDPINGQVYTLTVSLTNNSAGWVGVGFAQNGTANDGTSNGLFARHSNELQGRLWGLSRNRNDDQNQQFFEGGATANVNATASGDIVTDLANPFEIEIVLDTRNYTAWEYDVLYNGVSPLGGRVTAVNTADLQNNINFVGISNEVSAATDPPNIDKTLNSFRLEQMCDPGDVDCNGTVNMADFTPIQNNAFDEVTSRADGDLDGNGIVDFLDFRQWKANAGDLGVGVSFGSSVPEPGSAVLSLIAGCTWALTARRRRAAADAA